MKLMEKSGDAWCIDRYEFTGKGLKPRVRVSQSSAAKMCEGAGKRLCTIDEWEATCGRNYPYGSSYAEGRCNDGGAEGASLQNAGSARRCKSRSGAFDMAGNAAEWVSEGYAMGGSYADGP